MELAGQERISAPRALVWQALNDPEVLKACIPGCESIEILSPTEMRARVALKFGPIKANFAGLVTLSDIDPPNGYTISGAGSGGSAGDAKGSAQVRLMDDGDGSLLSYRVTSQVTGKVAQLGARLLDSAARKLAGDFFSKFRELVRAPSTIAAAATAPAIVPPAIAHASSWRWFIVFTAGTAALLVWIWFSTR